MASSENESKSKNLLEAQLQATLNVLPVYAWYTTASGALTFVNERHADYLGLPKDHPLRFGTDVGAEWDSHLPLLHPDDHAEMRRAWSNCLRTGCPGEVSFRARNAEGSYRWFLGRVDPLLASDGTLLYWIGVTLDIEERKQAEEALRRSEFYLAEGQRLSHTGSFGWKVSSGEIFWSDETFRIFRCDPATKPTLESVLSRVHPEDRELVQQQIERVSRDGEAFDSEYRLQMPDGAVKHVRVTAHPSRDSSGNLEFVGVVTDVSEQRHAEAVIREQEAELREVVDTIPAMVWTALPDGSNSYANSRCVEYSGLPKERMAGSGWQAVTHPDDLARHNAKWLACVASGEAFEDEVRFRRADGHYRWHLQRGIPVRDEAGNIFKWYGVHTDIEDRKRAEEELRQLVDLVPQVIVVLGPDGQWIHANRVAREYTGLTLDEYRSVDVIGRVIHPDDAEKVRATRKHAFSGSDPYEQEARLLGKDGIYRWFLFRYNPLVEEGRVKRWYGTATEIESRKQEEERVRQENVRLEERNRIARELHDTLLQTFLGASLQLGVAVENLPRDSQIKSKLDPILQFMEQGIEEGRNAIQGLRSSGSRPLDLVAALSAVREEFSGQPGVDFRVNVVGRQHVLRTTVQPDIYRIGKEALVNAFSHSRAKRIDLELEYTDSSLIIRVRDNGYGIDPRMLSAGREGHWGLAGMRERATKIGGLLEISSSATHGTEVQLSVPGGVAFERPCFES